MRLRARTTSRPRLNPLPIAEYNSLGENSLGQADNARPPGSVARWQIAIITKYWAWLAMRRRRPSRRLTARLRKNHPDVNPGDKSAEARFKEIQHAYDILSDQEKRTRYDQFGSAAFDGMAAAGQRPGGGEWTTHFGGQGFENVDLSDLLGSFGAGHQGGEAGGASIFEDLMGRVRGARPPRQRAGRSIEANLIIPFLTAARGGETTIEIQRGQGKPESLVVKIPAGIDTGAKLRLKGQGEPGTKTTPAGDLTITVQVEPHPYFKREGQNLQVEVPIAVAEAILGARIEVPALEGMKSLTVPPGSSSGQRLRIKGSRNSRDRWEASGGPLCLAQGCRAQIDRRGEQAVDRGVF